eukprot:TRINITY_DN93329_c0_g1_i1.p1 TRINITY_DN93329_c0_g1~~TRINITY_DN93329_c0_g1_i1.p1  ORF type:complete len:495 (-),score=120.48 TRINITY_DN93329_c0_g1_i1:72-1556(-)
MRLLFFLTTCAGSAVAIRSSSQLQAAENSSVACTNKLRVVTWNVENWGQGTEAKEKLSKQGVLTQFIVGQHSPDIILLQEMESCDLVNSKLLETYTCVRPAVSPAFEARTSITLGSLILFRSDAFYNVRDFENRAGKRRAPFRQKLDSSRDRSGNGKTLEERHSEECKNETSGWSELNDCDRSLDADIPKSNSARLLLNNETGYWCPQMLQTLAGGLRLMNVHLFSGGRRFKGMTRDKANAKRTGRRAFQMRSMMWLSDFWNAVDWHNWYDIPTTIYAGDFNSVHRNEMAKIVRAESDYGVQLWCPAAKGLCKNADRQKKTHAAGFLDHIAVDVRPASAKLRMKATGLVLTKRGRKLPSDHSPLMVEFQATGQSPAPGSTGKMPTPGASWIKPQETSIINDEEFPALGATAKPSDTTKDMKEDKAGPATMETSEGVEDHAKKTPVSAWSKLNQAEFEEEGDGQVEIAVCDIDVAEKKVTVHDDEEGWTVVRGRR